MWVLLNGVSAGISTPLVKRLPDPPITAPHPATKPAQTPEHRAEQEIEEMLAPVAYEVVHRICYVRSAPNRDGAQITALRKGEVVQACARCGDWIRLVGSGQAQWMLVDGMTAGDALSSVHDHCAPPWMPRLDLFLRLRPPF